MTLRRYSPMKPSRGTVIDAKTRAIVKARDKGCVGPRLGMEGPCFGGSELDHVEPGGMGRKGPSTPQALVQLCSIHHRVRTEHGRVWRPILREYLSRFHGKAA